MSKRHLVTLVPGETHEGASEPFQLLFSALRSVKAWRNAFCDKLDSEDPKSFKKNEPHVYDSGLMTFLDENFIAISES